VVVGKKLKDGFVEIIDRKTLEKEEVEVARVSQVLFEKIK